MAATDVRRVHALVSGRVQGVYYRASTQQQAAARGLAGWVRNLPDGRVELEAEGPADQVAALVDWLHRGPPAARVDAVELTKQPPKLAGGPFTVRR